MRTLSLIVLLLFSSMILNCSDNSAGGTSSSENAKVLAGVILSENNEPVNCVTVSLYDLDGTKSIANTKSDGLGRFYINIEAFNEFSAVAKITDSLTAYGAYENLILEDTLRDTLYLSANGALKLSFSSTIDASSDSIRILGTDNVYPLTSAKVNDNGDWEILLANLPAADLSSVVISTDTGFIELSESLKVFEKETSNVIIEMDKAIHQWKIPLIVSIKQNVADNFGGLDSIRGKILNQLDSASIIINNLSGLPGEFIFHADSFVTFTGNAQTEGSKPLGEFAHRLVYTDSTINNRGNRGLLDTRLHYIWLSSLSFDFFKEWDLQLLTHLLVECRGPMPLQYQNVNSGSFPVVHDGFNEISSVMHKNSYSDFMTDYTKEILLINRDIIGNERLILSKAISDTIIIVDTTEKSSNVYVFGSSLASVEIATDTLLKVEKVNNEYKISKEIFISNNNIENGILFIISDANQTRWLSLREVTEAWFAGNRSKYKITF